MKKMILVVPLVLGACATPVYHPNRDHALIQKDIDACTEASVLSSALRVAVVEDINACLRDMGYQKPPPGVRPAAPAAARPAAAKPPARPAPCAVPCRAPDGKGG